MHISLTEKLEKIVKNKVDSGLYNNASEVIREALRCMLKSDEVQALKLERLRDEVRPGYLSFPEGRHVVFYRQSEDTIEVVRILHDRMDPTLHFDL